MGIDVIVTIAIGVAAFTLSFLFIPAVVEIFSPKDAGPRFIDSCVDASRFFFIANLEEETLPAAKLPLKYAGFLMSVPGLEQSI